ncbi:MAG: hypothetical protein V4547_13275 [Bacteroidota bacterium]
MDTPARNQKIRFFLILPFISLMPLFGRSQNIGIGADVIYNFQTESIGAGARANFFPNSRLSIVPQFSYYFAFNKINEYYAGLGLEFKFIRRERVNFYAIAHGAYNVWINYAASPLEGAQPNNWNLEGGIGVSTNTCLRPFLEYRYNLKFMETHLRLGVLYIFGCNGGGGSRDKRCDAYRTN